MPTNFVGHCQPHEPDDHDAERKQLELRREWLRLNPGTPWDQWLALRGDAPPPKPVEPLAGQMSFDFDDRKPKRKRRN